jgi:hypothetical protein
MAFTLGLQVMPNPTPTLPRWISNSPQRMGRDLTASLFQRFKLPPEFSGTIQRAFKGEQLECVDHSSARTWSS